MLSFYNHIYGIARQAPRDPVESGRERCVPFPPEAIKVLDSEDSRSIFFPDRQGDGGTYVH